MKPSETGLPSLDHLRVLTVIVDEGSFSAAARRLNRAQSVVSYAVATLEAQLGLRLLDRSQRRPTLTDAGRAVLADARRMSLMMDDLRARAAGMSRGLEPEVSLAVDVMFPAATLVAVLRDFAGRFPTVGLRLRIEALGGVMALVLSGECGLGITGVLGPTDSLTSRPAGRVRLLPVAAPGHALAQRPQPIALPDLREHVQLVLTDRTPLTEGRDLGVFALRTWRLGDLGAKHALLRAGLGWGSMPEPMVAEDLAAGRLVRLHLQDRDATDYPQSLIHRSDTLPGPAARWLAERFVSAVEDAPQG
jgi:DNA-binding transcriptional LysR family regulator